MIERSQIFPIGSVTKTHGIHGEIAMTLDQDVDLAELRCIVFDMDGIYVPFFVSAVRTRGASAVLVTLDGITDEVQAAEFTGKQLFALKEDVDIDDNEIDPDNIYLEDLIGFKLIDTDGTEVGIISGYDDSTENTLFTVANTDGDDILIPAVDDLITDIDIEAKILTMNLPSGLI